MSSLSRAIGPTQHASWRELYLLALFEPTRQGESCGSNHGSGKGARPLVRHERELFRNPQDEAEREAVNRALQGLYTLRTCIRADRAASAA
jgi:hypothetical protein